MPACCPWSESEEYPVLLHAIYELILDYRTWLRTLIERTHRLGQDYNQLVHRKNLQNKIAPNHKAYNWTYLVGEVQFQVDLIDSSMFTRQNMFLG